MNYDGYLATAGINVGEQGYFDTESNVSLYQFERLFQLLSFKEEYKSRLLLAITGSSPDGSITSTNFQKELVRIVRFMLLNISTVKGHTVSLSCYFEKGEHRRKSNGLLKLGKDLKVFVHPSIKLAEFRALLTSYPAF